MHTKTFLYAKLTVIILMLFATVIYHDFIA